MPNISPKIQQQIQSMKPISLQALSVQSATVDNLTVPEKPKEAAEKPQSTSAQLENILDKSVLADIKAAQMNPVDGQVTFGQKGPKDLTHLKLNTDGQHYGKLTMTPVGQNEKPQKYILNGKDGNLTVHLGKGETQLSGINVKQWPPESVKFTDPENGNVVNGFHVELSSGDELFIPKGVNTSINNNTIEHDQFNQGFNHQILESGIFFEDIGPAMRYASVFALRQ